MNSETTAPSTPYRPGAAAAVVAVPAPGPGPQQWAGAPSAALDHDGTIVLAHRVRTRDADGTVHDATVIARSVDGESFGTVVVLDKDRWGAAMVERPALVRLPDRWRIYVSCATPASKHWWVGMLEAPTLAGLAEAPIVHVFDGDEVTAVKDPVVVFDPDAAGEPWQAWLCCHHLDVPGAEDRMSAAWVTSSDGVHWDWRGTVLRGRAGEWDARGARVTAVLPDGSFAYDGRATAEENWFERSGVARPAQPAAAGPAGFDAGLVADPGGPVADLRYLDLLTLPDGTRRLYYEARLPDESHELRTELLR